MVSKEQSAYKCEQCDLLYPTRELAQQCEDFCREHKSCSTDIIKHAIQP